MLIRTTQAKLEKLVDGGDLQLWVQPSGARQWRVAYRFAAKQKLLALGVYPSVTLAKARQARDEAKRLLAQGLDPSDDRKQRAQAKANEPRFRALADEFLARLKREARADATSGSASRSDIMGQAELPRRLAVNSTATYRAWHGRRANRLFQSPR